MKHAVLGYSHRKIGTWLLVRSSYEVLPKYNHQVIHRDEQAAVKITTFCVS